MLGSEPNVGLSWSMGPEYKLNSLNFLTYKTEVSNHPKQQQQRLVDICMPHAGCTLLNT